MFKHVVVPLDGSATAEKIVPWVKDYAARSGADVHLVQVLPRSGPSWGNKATTGRQREATRYLQSIAKGLASKGIRVRTHLKTGNPAAHIVDVLRHSGGDLIALTARGEGRFQRALLGGTAEKLLRRTDKAVLLVNEYSAPARRKAAASPKAILVPLDGSTLSESALPVALRLAKARKAKAVLVNVRADWNHNGVKNRRLEEIRSRFERAGVPTEVYVTKGDPATQILNAARRRNADLIVMNSHGRSGFARLMLGSVAEEIIHGGGVPVLMTRNRRPLRIPVPAADA